MAFKRNTLNLLSLRNKELLIMLKKKSTIAIIPVRLNSRRFPHKALAEIYSLPMIAHVYKRAALCKDLDDLIIATPDEELKNYAENILEANVVVTPKEHNNPIESSAFALQYYQKKINKQFDIAVIISGDEPMVTNDMIANAISPLYIDENVLVSCLMCEIKTEEEFHDPNEIKVVVDINNNAMYFSREAIPSPFKGKRGIPPLKKVNVMPFDSQFLIKLVQLPPATLELIEEIYLLRVLEYGYTVKMILIENTVYSVDTPEDLEKVKKAMKNDHLLKRYLSDMN